MKRTESRGWHEALAQIEACRQSGAKKLDLRYLRVKTLPIELFALTWLQELDLHGNYQLTDADVLAVAKHCPNLQALDVGFCKGVTDDTVRAVAEHCANLQSLNVKSHALLTPAAVLGVAEHCRNLQWLDVSFCSGVTDDTVRAVAEHCANLQSLHVAGCDQLTDAAVRAVAEHCPNLQSLDVWGCTNLTDGAVRAVAEHCPNLQSLNVYGCEQLTDAAVRALATGVTAQSLRRLKLHGTGVKELPRELIENADAQAIFEHVTRGERPLHAAKLLLVGQGEVGKTHLRRRLLENNPLYINPYEKRTHNIEMRRWSVEAPLTGGSTAVALRLLDFGGQPNLHAAHRFFLNDSRNLYVLVLDATRSAEQNRAAYWLRKIDYHSPGAPVIVLVTKCDAVTKNDDGTRQGLEELTLDALRKENPAVRTVVDDYGWSDQCERLAPEARRTAQQRHLEAQEQLVAEIRAALPHVPEIDERYVPGFHELMQWLEVELPDPDPKSRKRPRKALEVHRYLAQARKHGLSEALSLAYLEVYTSLGLVHYVGHRRDIRRVEEVTRWVFNPAWVKGPVYHLVRTPAGEHEHGVLDEPGVARRFGQPVERGDERPLWKRVAFDQEDGDRVLALMSCCELCFPFQVGDGSWRYLIPDLLPERETLSVWEDGELTQRDLKYEFLPENVLLRFIGKRYEWVADRVGGCFRNEVEIRPEAQPCTALVQADYASNKLRVTARDGDAAQRDRLLDRIAADLMDIMEPRTGLWPDADGTHEAAAPFERERRPSWVVDDIPRPHREPEAPLGRWQRFKERCAALWDAVPGPFKIAAAVVILAWLVLRYPDSTVTLLYAVFMGVAGVCYWIQVRRRYWLRHCVGACLTLAPVFGAGPTVVWKSRYAEHFDVEVLRQAAPSLAFGFGVLAFLFACLAVWHERDSKV